MAITNASPPPPRAGSLPPGLERQAARFAAFNRERLRRIIESLPGKHSALLQLLPLLFHGNHPGLPGFVSADTPCGVNDYQPASGALAAARQLVKDFTPDTRPRRNYAVRGLYLMGSPGTIAYTRGSDIDLWLMHSPDLAPAQVELLRARARAIEQHAAQLELEIHFFVMNADQFRRGQSLALSDESSGSSQHYLLLDEFYRSGLLLAGLKPLWWLVPPEEEATYEAFVARELAPQPSLMQTHIDFGGLSSVPAGEFFGASVWQLYKSIDSPWKSVLKLLLVEAYATAYPDTGQLLSLRHKRALLREGQHGQDLDPYIALNQRVEEYLLAAGDEARVRLLRRALYLKTEVRLSLPADPREPPWRRRVVEQLVGDWGWTPAEISHLDNRAHWRYLDAREERREIVRALQKSYAVLSEFARASGDQRISQVDLTVLGRRLYAAFDRKHDKLDIVSRGYCTAPEEAELTLHERSGEHGAYWLLFAGNVGPEETAHRPPLQRAPSLAAVLAWSFFNRVSDAGTNWYCFVGGRRAPALGCRKVLERLEAAFPSQDPLPTTSDDLSQPPRVVWAQAVVNASHDRATLAPQDSPAVLGERHDPFQSGSRRANVVHALDLLLQTSWGEVFAVHCAGPDAVLRACCDLLGRIGRPDATSVTPTFHCAEPDYGPAVVQRLEAAERLPERLQATASAEVPAVHVMKLGEHYASATLDGTNASARSHGSLAELSKFLCEPVASSARRVSFDPLCRAESPLSRVFAGHAPGEVRVFALPRRDRVDVFVLDGSGCLLQYMHPERDTTALFNQLDQFLALTRQRMAVAGAEVGGAIGFGLLQPGNGDYAVQPIATPIGSTRNFLPLRLHVDSAEPGKTRIDAYLDETEFSSAEYGNGVFKAVAAAVLARRASGERYPVFITDLELSERLLKARALEPRHLFELLRQKLRIEKQLSEAIAAAP